MTTCCQFIDTYRYPDDLMRRILAGCRTGQEWWGQHPTLPVQVSNMGRVRGVRGFVLKPYIHDGKYPCVDICGLRHVRIHHLVLTTFVGWCPDGMEACHWDGVKENCKLDNLRWDTRSANRQDSRRLREARQLAIRHRLEELATG